MERMTREQETPQDWTERMWDRYSGQILRFFARKGFSHETCRDLRQDVYIRAFENHKKDLDNEKAYLFAIVRSIWKNHLRRINSMGRKGQHTPIDSATLPTRSSPEAEMFGVHDSPMPDREARLKILYRDAVRVANEFPPRMRHTALLMLQGFRNHEIATLMNVSPQTVKTQVSLTRRRLREALGADADHFIHEEHTLGGDG